jgi:hypothetical protein
MASRRRFTAAYKLGILKAADACTAPGSLGSLLRREGLYSSNLNTWKRQRDCGSIEGLTPKKRGRKESGRNPLIAENENLRKQNDRLAPPEVVHYGLAEKIQKARGEVLIAAYEAHPERFVRKRPVPPSAPAAVWINKPKEEPISEETLH